MAWKRMGMRLLRHLCFAGGLPKPRQNTSLPSEGRPCCRPLQQHATDGARRPKCSVGFFLERS